MNLSQVMIRMQLVRVRNNAALLLEQQPLATQIIEESIFEITGKTFWPGEAKYRSLKADMVYDGELRTMDGELVDVNHLPTADDWEVID